MGTKVQVRRVDLAVWTLRTSPKLTTEVKYQFHQGFYQIRDPDMPITRLSQVTDRKLNNLMFFYLQGFFRGKSIVSYCWGSNVL